MKISVIIPAYNEEKTIGKILTTIKKSSIIDEIIAIDDGSIDKTFQEMKKHNPGIKIIHFDKNRGKGDALMAGVKQAKNPIILFIDSDLVGLKTQHISDLIKPIINKKADLTLGLLGSDIHRGTNLASRMFPGISGQRAFSKKLLADFSAPKNCRFSIDLLITKHIRRNHKIQIKNIDLRGVTQVTKEEKLGKLIGLWHRVGMYKDILRVYLISHYYENKI